MNQTFLFLVISLFPFLLYAQGIQWTTDLSWEQVKEKARQENKYIFVDCYATWCGPCKIMDRDIYPLKEIGQLYNEKFISIRVQADRTDKDDDHIKNLYHDAEKINAQYKVVAYPTFLFMTPNAELLHRASGGMNAEKFTAMANDALQQKGYGSLIKKFQSGKFENLNLKELAISAKYAGDDSIAKLIAGAYIESISVHDLINQDNLTFVFTFNQNDEKWGQKVCMPKINHLSIDQLANPNAIRFLLYAAKNDSLAVKATDSWITRMSIAELFDKNTLEYLKQFVRQSKDKSFLFLYKNTTQIDKIMGKKNWAQDALDDVIIKEEFYKPLYNPAYKLITAGKKGVTLPEPDWQELQDKITAKYGISYAHRLQFSPKIQWYNLVDNKREYIKNLIADMERTKGWDLNGLALNNSAMEVFRFSTSRNELKLAAKWMAKYYEKNPKELKTDAAGIDTYAILLYKAGLVQEGIKWEEKAIIIDSSDSGIADNLSKMKKGIPIWPKGFDVKN